MAIVVNLNFYFYNFVLKKSIQNSDIFFSDEIFKWLIKKLTKLIFFFVLNRFIIRNNSIWDRLVFKPVREGMGGRVRLLVCGSAPLAGNVLTFMRCALGCLVSKFFFHAFIDLFSKF